MFDEKLNPSQLWKMWSEAESKQRASLIRYWRGGLIMAALGESQSPELWVEVAESMKSHDGVSKASIEVKGLDLLLDTVIVEGRNCQVVNIRLADKHFEEIFSSFADLIVDDLVSDQGCKGTQFEVESKVSKWMDFFTKDRSPISRENVLGLIGELTFLKQVADNSLLSCKVWTGPFGESKDFVGPTIDFEVKVCGNRNGPLLHRISSLDQLQQSAGKQLFLYSLRVHLGNNLTNSVNELVEEVRQLPMFSRDVSSAAYFSQALTKYGFTEALPAEYSSYELLESHIFQVDEDFPKISKSMIEYIPEVVALQYTLDLTAQEEYPNFIIPNKL